MANGTAYISSVLFVPVPVAHVHRGVARNTLAAFKRETSAVCTRGRMCRKPASLHGLPHVTTPSLRVLDAASVFSLAS